MAAVTCNNCMPSPSLCVVSTQQMQQRTVTLCSYLCLYRIRYCTDIVMSYIDFHVLEDVCQELLRTVLDETDLYHELNLAASNVQYYCHSDIHWKMLNLRCTHMRTRIILCLLLPAQCSAPEAYCDSPVRYFTGQYHFPITHLVVWTTVQYRCTVQMYSTHLVVYLHQI